MPLATVLVAFYHQTHGFKTRYRLCWVCGYWLARSCEKRALSTDS